MIVAEHTEARPVFPYTLSTSDKVCIRLASKQCDKLSNYLYNSLNTDKFGTLAHLGPKRLLKSGTQRNFFEAGLQEPLDHLRGKVPHQTTEFLDSAPTKYEGHRDSAPTLAYAAQANHIKIDFYL